MLGLKMTLNGRWPPMEERGHINIEYISDRWLDLQILKLNLGDQAEINKDHICTMKEDLKN